MKNSQNLQKKLDFLIKSETYEAIINKYKNKYFNKINIDNLTKISHIKTSNNKGQIMPKNTTFCQKLSKKWEFISEDLTKNLQK